MVSKTAAPQSVLWNMQRLQQISRIPYLPHHYLRPPFEINTSSILVFVNHQCSLSWHLQFCWVVLFRWLLDFFYWCGPATRYVGRSHPQRCTSSHLPTARGAIAAKELWCERQLLMVQTGHKYHATICLHTTVDSQSRDIVRPYFYTTCFAYSRSCLPFRNGTVFAQ